MSEKTTARVRREELRAEGSRELSRVLARHDLTQSQLADAVGASKQQVQEWCDHTSPKGPQLQDVQLMPEAVALDLLTSLAASLGFSLTRVESARDVDFSALAHIAAEANDVVRAMAESLADGQLSAAELERIQLEANQAARAFQELSLSAGKRLGESKRALRAVASK